jgi:hypothetical protein
MFEPVFFSFEIENRRTRAHAGSQHKGTSRQLSTLNPRDPSSSALWFLGQGFSV